MSRSFHELRRVAESASGTTRVHWSPQEALAVLVRLEQLEQSFETAVNDRVQLVLKESEIALTEARQAIDILSERERQLDSVKERAESERQLIEAAIEYVGWCKGDGDIEEREERWRRLGEKVDDVAGKLAAEPVV